MNKPQTQSNVPESDLRFIREDVKEMHAYAVQDATGMLKLDAMENPFSLPRDLATQLGLRLAKVAVNRYPGAQVEELKKALAEYAKMPSGYQLVLGNGSDELISLLSLACAGVSTREQDCAVGANQEHLGQAHFGADAHCVLAPEPGFVMYAVSAKLQGLRYVGVNLLEDFELDVPAMLSAIQAHKPAIVYLAYPNNPSANLWSKDSIRAIIEAVSAYGGWVVVDEAYQPFSSHSWLDEIRVDPAAHRQVLLMRTLSKFGLAGVRIGYLIGPSAVVSEIEKIRPPYNVSVLNAECALFALEHEEVFAKQAQVIRDEREKLINHLAKLKGVTPFKSEGNMVLVRFAQGGAGVDHAQALKIFEALKAKRILVKNVSKMHSLLVGCLRFTVGTPEENTQLLLALDELCAG